MWIRSLGREDPLEKEMATYSTILAWEILWTEEPGGLPFMGSQRFGHDLVAIQQEQREPYGAANSDSVPVQSDEVQVGALWIMVPLCRPPPSWLSSLFPSHCTTSVPVGIVVARWTHPYFLLSHCQPLPYRHSIFHRGSSFGDSQIILRSSWVWLSPFSRLSNWGMKLFSESQHCIPGLQNCSQCSFHCSSTNIPAHSIGEKMSVALLVYCDVLSFSSLLKFNMLQLME